VYITPQRYEYKKQHSKNKSARKENRKKKKDSILAIYDTTMDRFLPILGMDFSLALALV